MILRIPQSDFAAFIKTPACEKAIAAGTVIQLVRADGSLGVQIFCPQDRLACCDDLDRAVEKADAANSRVAYVERLETENAKLKAENAILQNHEVERAACCMENEDDAKKFRKALGTVSSLISEMQDEEPVDCVRDIDHVVRTALRVTP